jgi:hypothetical protein
MIRVITAVSTFKAPLIHQFEKPRSLIFICESSIGYEKRIPDSVNYKDVGTDIFDFLHLGPGIVCFDSTNLGVDSAFGNTQGSHFRFCSNEYPEEQ